jgi:hypothetical protein
MRYSIASRGGYYSPYCRGLGGGTIRRALFVSEQLLAADLEVFVEARTIDPKYLFLLYPANDAVWEIRSGREQPSIRVLGLFAWKDVFVATNHALREELGGWESREWKTVKRAARAEWRRLFNPYQPKTAIDPKQLVTGALDGKYFKAAGPQ